MGRKRGLSVVLPSVNHLSRSVHAGRDFPSLAVGDERCRTDGAWKGNGAVPECTGRSFPYAGCRGGFRFGRCRSGRQRKNESRMKRRVHAGYAPYVRHVSCSMRRAAGGAVRRGISTGRSCRRIIWAAVADAAVSDASEVYRDLPCIVSPTPATGWSGRNAADGSSCSSVP